MHLYFLIMSQIGFYYINPQYKTKVIWTLIITIMSSILYLLSYSLFKGLGEVRTRDFNIESIMSYHLTTNPKPNVSIALTSIDYKTIALLLC